MQTLKARRGKPYPLGATVTENGVNFAVFSENATAVDLCLFEEAGSSAEMLRIRLSEQTDHVWHCALDVPAGQLYGYRVHGPYEPQHGHRFNSSKLLLDPYAKAITGRINWDRELFGYPLGSGDDADLRRDDRDSAACMPKCIVVDDAFDWGDDKPPCVRLAETIFYEVHVKGFSQLCPSIPEDLRGKYAGLGSDFAIDYFQKLGVTAVELLPVHHYSNDQFLEEKGLANYWGYNSLGFFAPHSAYAKNGTIGEQVTEFKEMVKRLHGAGLEVILDVVYNHTGEGNHLGPTISFKGLDNAAYYRLVHDDKRFCMDYTGTGNTLNVPHPAALQLVTDSLRYWVEQMHVDGFRFDLAPTLAREAHDVSRTSAFFNCLRQDPVLSQVKLIAEPWDCGEGGYQVGRFPAPWAEWNGKYRDCVRAFWKGDFGQLGELAYRLTGSADLYESNGRRPYASVNLITTHDGFTLYDTVAYNEKHNEANGENNQDGHNDNRSWNCGAEGPTEDEEVNKLRRKQLRNFLATLLLSEGVPLLVGGDEFGRTQKGNNNAYCQDNEISWFDWNHAAWQKDLLAVTMKLIAIRREHPVFRRPKYFQGRRNPTSGAKDILWFGTDGSEMTGEDWSGENRCIGMMLSGDALDVRDANGDPLRDDAFLMIFNAHDQPVNYVLAGKEGVHWKLVIDTRLETAAPEKSAEFIAGDEFEVEGRSMCVLQLATGSQEDARNVSWKHRQKAEPAGPPEQPSPLKHEPIDPTTLGPRRRALAAKPPTVSEITQGAEDQTGPNIKTPPPPGSPPPTSS